MIKFLINAVSSNGSVSSKRVVTFAAFIVMAIGFLANQFAGLKVEQYIYESMQWIVMVGIGATASENFSKKAGVTNVIEKPKADQSDPSEPVIN